MNQYDPYYRHQTRTNVVTRISLAVLAFGSRRRGIVLHAGVMLEMLGWVSWDLDGRGGRFAFLTSLSTPFIGLHGRRRSEGDRRG
jgi:hypothetical protein